MDTKLAVHAGAEVIVIGGIFLYLNKQLSTLKEQNDALMKEVEQLKRVLQAHDDILGSIYEKRHELVEHQQPAMQLRRRRKETPPPKKEYKDEELDGELEKELKEDTTPKEEPAE